MGRRTSGQTLPDAASPEIAIAGRIQIIRGVRVMLDADLAALYGVSTTRLNEAVRRNHLRFPEDFMFQLTSAEHEKLEIANCDFKP